VARPRDQGATIGGVVLLFAALIFGKNIADGPLQST